MGAMAYRGYSESEGVAHEEGLKKDADAIMDFIADPTVNQEISAKLNSKMVFVHGKGLGAALAIYMAHEREHLWQGHIAERNDGLVPYEQTKELYELSTKVNFKN